MGTTSAVFGHLGCSIFDLFPGPQFSLFVIVILATGRGDKDNILGNQDPSELYYCELSKLLYYTLRVRVLYQRDSLPSHLQDNVRGGEGKILSLVNRQSPPVF